jgi:hypothetical protein
MYGGAEVRSTYSSRHYMEEIGFTLLPLYPRRKSTQYPLNTRLSGPQSKSGRAGEEKKSLPLPKFESRSSSHYTDWATHTYTHTHIYIYIRGCIQNFPDCHYEICNNNNKHSLISNTKGHETDSKNSDTTATSGRELYHLQFCSSRSRRSVRKLLDTLSYISQLVGHLCTICMAYSSRKGYYSEENTCSNFMYFYSNYSNVTLVHVLNSGEMVVRAE